MQKIEKKGIPKKTPNAAHLSRFSAFIPTYIILNTIINANEGPKQTDRGKKAKKTRASCQNDNKRETRDSARTEPQRHHTTSNKIYIKRLGYAERTQSVREGRNEERLGRQGKRNKAQRRQDRGRQSENKGLCGPQRGAVKIGGALQGLKGDFHVRHGRADERQAERFQMTEPAMANAQTQ